MRALARPVSFRYIKPFADGSKPIEYGLIAEEVAEVFPYLAVFNAEGQPETVKYHLLPTFLLAGYQEQQRVIAAQADRISALESQVAEQRAAHQASIEVQQYETAAVEERLQRRLTELEAQLAQIAKVLPAAQSTAFVQSEAQAAAANLKAED